MKTVRRDGGAQPARIDESALLLDGRLTGKWCPETKESGAQEKTIVLNVIESC